MILWYPKTNNGPSLFYYASSSSSVNIDAGSGTFPPLLVSGAIPSSNIAWKLGFA